MYSYRKTLLNALCNNKIIGFQSKKWINLGKKDTTIVVHVKTYPSKVYGSFLVVRVHQKIDSSTLKVTFKAKFKINNSITPQAKKLGKYEDFVCLKSAFMLSLHSELEL